MQAEAPRTLTFNLPHQLATNLGLWARVSILCFGYVPCVKLKLGCMMVSWPLTEPI
jgi:hypothetical protein